MTARREEDVEAQANTALEIAREIINGEREVSTGPRCMTSWEQSLLAREVVRLSGELDRMRATVGLLRPEEAENFWHQYRTHPALSVGAEQEEPDAADMADPHWSGGHPHA